MWQAFREIRSSIPPLPYGGIQQISFRDIEAWAATTGEELGGIDARLIRALDEVMVGEVLDGKKKAKPDG